MSTQGKSGHSQLQQALISALDGNARFDPFTRALYSTDASNFQIEPLGVVFPRHTDELQAIVEVARRFHVPVIARGSGTSMAGQTLGHGLIIDCTRHLDQIRAFNREESTVVVEPGVVLARLNREAAGLGLMFGPDPASSDRATLGGMVGNNATGAHSIRYGLTIDHVLEADVVLSDGSSVVFRPLERDELQRKLSLTSLEGDLYRAADMVRANYDQAIKQHWPRTWRRASGYSLNYLTGFTPGEPPVWFDAGLIYPPTAGLNLTPLLCGSEGTLALIRSLKLRLVQRPNYTALAIRSYDSIEAAAEATLEILESSPDAIELLPRTLLERARQIPAYARRMGFLQGDPAALLVVEYSGSQLEKAIGQASKLKNVLVLGSIEEQADLWAVRKVGLGLLMSVPGDLKPITFIEDVSVPVERLAEYVRRVDRILDDHGTYGEWYAHASAGCLHLRPLINLKTLHGVEQMRGIAEEVVDVVIEMGGAISGEHGDGLSHTEYNERLFGPELNQAFHELKQAFDPREILNPGKVIPAVDGFGGPGALTSDLRYGPEYRAQIPTTKFDFFREGSFTAAVESCTGLGVCRKDDGLMCPSYQATREEEHSTRGRANALRAVLSGVLPARSLHDEALYKILDLCLECKGCKAECPTAVDMARIKAAFLDLYYERHGIPLRSRLFANLRKMTEIGAKLARPLNWASGSAIFRRLQEHVMGISRFRTVPKLSEHTFVSRYKPPSRVDNRPAVILFLDTYTNAIDPSIGDSACKVLDAAGYQVQLVKKQGCCGRPSISKGLLDHARTLAQANLEALAPYASQGIPIIGLEPSCLLTLRDEYLEFFPGDPMADVIARHSWLLEEFLVLPDEDGVRPLDRLVFKPSTGSRIHLHNHCFSKALIGSGPLLDTLRGAGYLVEEIPSGCCGMAGSFGYEAEHYDLSIKIAGQLLLPAALEASASGSLIAAGGISCRTQLMDGAQIKSYHPAHLLADALVDEGKPDG